MKAKLNPTLAAPYLILLAVFFLSALSAAPAKEFNLDRIKEQIKVAKDLSQLNLGVDKEKALLNLEQNYAKDRHALINSLKQYQEDLNTALAGTAQDEAKIKNLVSAIAATQDKLLSSVNMERDEAMNLMNPIQQGKFLVMLGNWYQEMLLKSEKKKS